jgi:cytoskeletal protein RodZ
MPAKRRAAPVSGEGAGTAQERAAEALRAFGRYLVRERELRGLSRQDVARITKLAPGVVGSIESGDPARLPPGGYLHGCLRSYAGAVGLDPDDVVLRFQEVAGPAEEAQPAPPVVRARRPVRRTWRLVLAAVALAALAILALRLWGASRLPREIRGRPSPERAPYGAPSGP